MVVVALLGVLVFDRVARGLVTTQRQRALAEVDSSLQYASATLSTVETDANPEAVDQRLRELIQQLAIRAGAAGTYDVALLGGPLGDLVSSLQGPDVTTVPNSLREAVRGGSNMAYAYSDLRSGKRVSRRLVVGAPLYAPSRRYELYFFFPLNLETSTLSSVRSALLGGGLALALLVAGVTWLVAKQVVSPVRAAARVADQFAGGRLESRMQVKGDDEIARLGEAFNAMAVSLQQKIDQLQGLSRLQQRFVSDVSHELRTPLTTVRMAADVLHSSRGTFPVEVARSAELLQNELDRFESLLVDLLEISRFDAGAAVLDAEVFDVSALLHRVVTALGPLAARRGSEVTVRAAAGTDVLLEADPRRVERVLRNLLANAIEHGEGLPIDVAFGGDAEVVAIVVRDRGVGLRPGEASRVFSRFWRGDPSRARHTGGTGLGLSIALEDVRLHGGWLQAWGEPGRGSAFRVTLPRQVGGDVRSSPLPLEPGAVTFRG
ncbi:MAG: two-component system, OmpR family, sensor histidine kinase MtrB [Frankiaceae bacterium]|jgi:two-component system sensor histidine kinase MtrB|nr:two-component system, OmpR family, sensor histidine kinase MtrB [Frankiaceae bacterium]